MTVLIFLCLSLFQASDSSRVEWIRAWFSAPHDPELEFSGVKINSDADLMAPLIEQIDRTASSLDMALYDIENMNVVEAIVRAKKRGVRVRIATDNFNRTDNKVLDKLVHDLFGQNNILSIDDDGDVFLAQRIIDSDFPNDGAQMHHKFAVFDYETPDKEDDFVWTGSTNVTETGVINTNVILLIKDSGITEIYKKEFDQLWGGPDIKPDEKKAGFHKDKAYVGQREFWVGNTRVEVYFSPMNRDKSKPSISDRLVELMEIETQHDISFSAFSISPNIPISMALWRLSDNPDISLKGVIDRRFYSRYKDEIWGSPEAQSGNRSIYPANELRILHHKTLVIDAFNPDPNDGGIVVTGSYNFSKAAEQSNDENLLIIHNDSLAKVFALDFSGIYGRATERLPVPAPKIDVSKPLLVKRILDGHRFEVNIAHGFDYEVQLLGVDAPRIYDSLDSVAVWADPAKQFLELMLLGKNVFVQGPNGGVPHSKYQRFYAYVNTEDGLAVNRTVLATGHGTYSRYFAQLPDSIGLFKQAEAAAKEKKLGLWEDETVLTKKVPNPHRKAKKIEANFPVNINTAGIDELATLPRIGAKRAQDIIDYRAKNGGFKTVDELKNIKGIGVKTLENLRPLVVLDDEEIPFE